MDWLEQEKKRFVSVFKRLPIEVQRGEGCYLIDRHGKKYLDFLGGLGVNALGYTHPDVLQAIRKQLTRNMHLSNYFVQDVQLELAEKILQLSGYDRLFFTNSGTESIEGILKLIKKWANLNNKDQIICFQGGFHGRSLGSLSITAQEKYQKDFQPLIPRIHNLPYNDTSALQNMVGSRTAAIFLEFIQGEGGVRLAQPGFLEAIRQAQENYNVLLVADEIQTGVGRTGKFLAFQHYPIQPDFVAIAKAVGGGLPLGAFLLNEKFNEVFRRGEHGTTFGGNPVSCAAGLATLTFMEKNQMFEHVQSQGLYFRQRLDELKNEFPGLIRQVRGLGLMLGAELTVETYSLVLKGLQKGVIFNSTSGNILRFLPPLIISRQQIDEGLTVLTGLLKEMTH